MFVDESGEREYAPRTSLYFVYLGCVVEKKNVSSIEQEFKRIKRAYLGTEQVEFKSNWFRIPKERKKHYLIPFNITNTILREMTGEIYRVIKSSPITLLASVIDKREMREKYGEKAYSPSSWGYELLIERYQYFLQRVGGEGDVIVDKISGKKPWGRYPYMKLIKRVHVKMQKDGSTLQKVIVDRVKGMPSFKSSDTSNLLQVADFCAYNVMRQFRDYGGEWEEPTERYLRMYPFFREIVGKLHKGPGGQIQGFGIKKFPEKRKVGWRIKNG